MARRQAGDARRRDLLARRLQEKSPAAFAPITATSSRPRRPASARSPSPSTGRAIANCRRSSASSTCCRSIGGKAPTRPATSATSSATTLEPPLGCGPYRIKEFVAGRTIVFERVKDYWGKDLNVNIGRDNFDEMRYEYFRDSTVALEAFKGDVVDWRTENSAKNWATAYDFPAVSDKRVVLEEFPIRILGRHAGVRVQHPARRSSRIRACGARSTRVRFRGDEQADLLRPVQAHRQLFRGHRACVAAGLPRGPGTGNPAKPCATRCRRKSSPRPTPIRSAAARRTCAPICARRCGCCRRPATRCATGSSSMSRPASR